MKTTLLRAIIILAKITLSICNLTANDSCLINKEYEPIYLVGEEHDNEECISLKKSLRVEAENGGIILALEGSLFSVGDNSSIFGIEEQNIYYASWALLYYGYFALYKIIQDVISSGDSEQTIENSEIINTFNTHRGLRYVSKSWETMISTIKKIGTDNWATISNNEDIIKCFSRIDLTKLDQFTETFSFETPFFLNLCEDVSLWINLFKDVTNFYIHAVTESAQISPDVTDQVITYMKQFEEYLKMDIDIKRSALPAIWNRYLKFQQTEDVVLTPRNHVFLENIATIFEKVKSQKKPLYVVIGSAHAPFLYEALIQRGYSIKLNDWAQLEYDKVVISEVRNGKRQIDKQSANARDLVRRILEKFDGEQPEMQKIALGRLGTLVDFELIDQKVLYEYDLVNRVIDRFDVDPLNALFFLGVLVEYELMDKKAIDTYKLIQLAMDHLNHKQFGVKVNALWILSLLLEEGGLPTIKLTAKSVEDCHLYLINSDIILPKRRIERITPVFSQFLAHPDEKIRNLAAEIILRLEKMLPIDNA